jgi:hypothetical protein
MIPLIMASDLFYRPFQETPARTERRIYQVQVAVAVYFVHMA